MAMDYRCLPYFHRDPTKKNARFFNEFSKKHLQNISDLEGI